MVVATGKSILNGIAIGKIKIYKAPVYDINMGLITDVDAEVARFNAAVDKAIEQQGVLYEKAKKDAGEESAAIFEAHQLMVDDEDFIESVENIIETESVNAEYDVRNVKSFSSCLMRTCFGYAQHLFHLFRNTRFVAYI